MDAMVLHRIGAPLVRETRPDPVPGPGEVRIRVEACAVCRTDLHVIDGALVPAALGAVRKGGSVVCGGIHMSDIPAFPDSLLWGERRVLSVASLTREDARSFFALAPRVGIVTRTRVFPLTQAEAAIAAHRSGIEGAAVLVP